MPSEPQGDMMGYRFGVQSEHKLRTCHSDLQRVIRRALAMGVIDITVIDGHRNQVRQDAYFYARPQKSKVRWPHGKHNRFPSDAVDVAPWVAGEIPWDDSRYWYTLAGVVMAAAAVERVKLRAGYDWDGDTEVTDQTFHDLGHFERKE